MRVLFLDIDGVLLPMEFLRKTGDPRMIEPIRVEMLNIICDATDCYVVVSSTWRRDIDCREQLIKAGFQGKFHDEWRTPISGGFLSRGEEIEYWLDNHMECERYVILDDDSDMLEHQRKYHVKTKTEDGLRGRHIIQAVEILTWWGTND